MKIKVSPKDLGIFIVFCIFLLYFSSIAVLNVLSIINEGTFYGFVPFEAFTSKYIFLTLLVFFSILIAVFFSVSSSIFSRSSGIGLSLGEKEEKGYSRWLKEKEMKKGYKVFKVGVKDIDASVGGIVLINDGKNMWVDDSEFHTLVIGTTGSGKTTAVVDPLIYSLCKHRESMIFTDPKGEIYTNHAELLKARGYNIVVLNFRNPQMGNAWNPLTLPYQLYHEGNIDKAIELVDDVANNIVKDKQAQDPFWQNSSADYFSGCTLGLLEDAKEEEVNLNSISLMTTVGEEKFGAGSTYIKEYFGLKGEQSSAYTFASNTINSPTETKGGILSTFRQKIRIFSSRENLSEMLSYSDFNMRDIGKVPTAVFMIIHDEKTTYHALATIFIKQCYETLISVAQECGGKLPVRTNFILDEFANMPALKDVTTMVTAARSRLIRFTFIIQNFSQLNDVYGKEDAETIRSNCGNLIYILTTELSALEEISKLCGEVKVDKSKGDTRESRPLVTVSDLQKMKINEVIILRNRLNPFKTQLVQAFNVDWGDKEFGKAEFYEREKREIQYFDIKEFVKVRKRSKMGIDDKSSGFAGMGRPAPNFSSLMGDANNTPRETPKIPTFEEFMAARNGQKQAQPVEPKKPVMPTFDVDDLVKRIDAKIAELEAQEKEETLKSQSGTSTTNSVPNVLPTNPVIPSNNVPSSTSTANNDIPSSTTNVNNVPSSVSTTVQPQKNILNIEDVSKQKDIISGIDNIETSPINAPIIKSSSTPETHKPVTEINTFSDLMNNGGNIPKEVVKETPPVPNNTFIDTGAPTTNTSPLVTNNTDDSNDFFDDFFDND
jgi:type IV secretion system protein VirD4